MAAKKAVSKDVLQAALSALEELRAGWAWNETLGDLAVKGLRSSLGKDAWHARSAKQR